MASSSCSEDGYLFLKGATKLVFHQSGWWILLPCVLPWEFRKLVLMSWRDIVRNFFGIIKVLVVQPLPSLGRRLNHKDRKKMRTSISPF